VEDSQITVNGVKIDREVLDTMRRAGWEPVAYQWVVVAQALQPDGSLIQRMIYPVTAMDGDTAFDILKQFVRGVREKHDETS